MNEMLTLDDRTEQDRRIAQAVAREGSRLKAFIRQRVADAGDAEDILQEVLSELVEAVRLMTPIEQSPEEREKLRERLRQRWGSCEEAESSS